MPKPLIFWAHADTPKSWCEYWYKVGRFKLFCQWEKSHIPKHSPRLNQSIQKLKEGLTACQIFAF